MGTQDEDTLLSLGRGREEMCVNGDLRKIGHLSCHEVEKGGKGRTYFLYKSPPV